MPDSQAAPDDTPQQDLDKAVAQKIELWKKAKHKANPHGFISVAEEGEMRRRIFELEAIERGLPLREVKPPPEPVLTFKTFIERKFPPKQALIEDLLYRRDMVALAGRRRHGKTTFICNLALALIVGRAEFLGYRIPRPVRVLAFFLEDDAGELQVKLQRMCKDQAPQEGLAVFTREDFYRAGVPIDINIQKFKKFIVDMCATHHPDVVVFDNLAHLIGADYSNSKLIHQLLRFVWQLTADFNVAVIIAAHPRKRDKKSADTLNPSGAVHLRGDPEGFFEEVMGSSHFVNSCGSLWGLDRDLSTNRTDFLGGTQRFTGQESIMTLEKDEDDWLRRVDDFEVNLALALTTPLRNHAWGLLPDHPFTYTEGEKAVKLAMKSSSSFHEWFEHCKRLGVIVSDGEKYKKGSKAASGGTPGKQPR